MPIFSAKKVDREKALHNSGHPNQLQSVAHIRAGQQAAACHAPACYQIIQQIGNPACVYGVALYNPQGFPYNKEEAVKTRYRPAVTLIALA